MTFGEKLRQLREQAGMTQQALADASGLPLPSIRGYEQGQREPLWSVIFKLTRAMGVSCEAFAECDLDGPTTPAAAPAVRRTGKKMAAHPRKRPDPGAK